jgi:hypothetical protein
MSADTVMYGLRNAQGRWFTQKGGVFAFDAWTWKPVPSYPFNTWDLAEAARLALDYPGDLQIVKEGDP